MASSYSDKLRDPRWQRKRLEIMDRDMWKCRCCFQDTSMLSVHHRVYITDTDPWDYPNKYLVTLCEFCHEDETNRKIELEEILLRSLRMCFFNYSLTELIEGFEKLNPDGMSSYVGLSLALKNALATPRILEFLEYEYDWHCDEIIIEATLSGAKKGSNG